MKDPDALVKLSVIELDNRADQPVEESINSILAEDERLDRSEAALTVIQEELKDEK